MKIVVRKPKFALYDFVQINNNRVGQIVGYQLTKFCGDHGYKIKYMVCYRKPYDRNYSTEALPEDNLKKTTLE